jgi:acetamidase/formamidase
MVDLYQKYKVYTEDKKANFKTKSLEAVCTIQSGQRVKIQSMSKFSQKILSNRHWKDCNRSDRVIYRRRNI